MEIITIWSLRFEPTFSDAKETSLKSKPSWTHLPTLKKTLSTSGTHEHNKQLPGEDVPTRLPQCQAVRRLENL